MKHAFTLLALLALAPVPADTLAFGPEKGTQLAKHFEAHMNLEKRSMKITIGGREMPSEIGEKATMEMTMEKLADIEDEYVAMDGARPLELKRRYASLADRETTNVQMPGMEEPKEDKKEKESKLEGKTVVFRWNADKDAYTKKWDGEGAGDELLEKLEEDMDLRALLPGKDLSEGDTWDIDIKKVDDLFGPSGDLGFERDEKDDDSFEENMTGSATCTYKGIREEDGRKLAHIALACKAKTFMDVDKDGGDGRMDFEIELDGEYLWDVRGRHLASYGLEGELSATLVMKQELDMGGQKHQLEMEIVLGGKMAVKGEFTKP